MTMILKDFSSKFNDFIRTNLYVVHMISPTNPTEYSNQSLSFLCKDATFPFYTMNTQKLNYNNKTKTYAAEIDFDPATFVFHLDSSNKIFKFFRDWNEILIDTETRQLEFKDNYTGTILVEVYDTKGRLKFSVTLWDAFPINIENMQLSYASNNELLAMSVSFSFDDVSYEIHNSSMPSTEYITHMKERLRPYPEPFSFKWPWDSFLSGAKGWAEGILGKKLTHQIESRATNFAKSKINKKVGINAIPNAKNVMNIGATAGRSPLSSTATKSARLFKF